ncbi:GNAT family N-acetyltransferase [Clostridium ihumii]|uniref:GNAT family N-acetyltransferase n=1 Tax=Clostridium ihumii TaxID=1470356 RepID=UPI003D34BACA
MINKKIIECELEYLKCFSEFEQDDAIIRFFDSSLQDMYFHNYTYVKNAMDKSMLKSIIENEIKIRLHNKHNFCNILLTSEIDKSSIPSFNYKEALSTFGFYSFNLSKLSKLNSREDCIVKIVSNKKMLDDILFCDLAHDEETLGRDFCTRRCYRRGQVYLSDKGVNSYICYHNDKIIGNCDLFIHNGVAKIEDFAVIPKYQRMGYGTTILKHLINIALKENCIICYLDTDEDDTAKEMYEKIGFTKLFERNNLFFNLNVKY